MSQGTITTEALTEDELRDAGASATYIAYYLQAQEMGIETASTRHAEKVVKEGVRYPGGGFHEALWDASPRFAGADNPYGADMQNAKILAEAGVYPYTE
jgi:hypothetical protein